MKIRRYEDSDLTAVAKLFYQTVHSVCAADYDPLGLYAWAPDPECLLARREDLKKQKTLVCEIDGKLAGFASLDNSGCLDLLFVHKDMQRKGIATALCDAMEKGLSEIKTFASLTAKPFFDKRGYVAVKEQEVERRGVKLKNYEMVKATVARDEK